MPIQDQTGSDEQGASTGKDQSKCRNTKQTSTDQDTSLFGALRRRFRAGGQGQGQRKGRGNGAGFCGKGRR